MPSGSRGTSYELPTPGNGVSGLQLFRFLGSLLPVWYRLLLLLSGLLILVPFAFFDEAQWTVGVFLGFSAPLVFAVIISPILRVRYGADVVRRLTVTSDELLIETLAEDHRLALERISRIEVATSIADTVRRWRIEGAGSVLALRIWVPASAASVKHEYAVLTAELSKRLADRFHQKETA